MKVHAAIETLLGLEPHAAAKTAGKARDVAPNANYNVPTNWRSARSTTTVSFCDGTLAAAFVTVSHGTPP